MRVLSTTMMISLLSGGLLLVAVTGHAAAETVTAKLDSVACAYHDVLWDKTGYDKEGRLTPEMLALDICTGINSGQELELFERQNYAPGGLRIVRINSKLYFVRMRDLEPKKRASEGATPAKSKPQGAAKPTSD